jgi:hypothetical protein
MKSSERNNLLSIFNMLDHPVLLPDLSFTILLFSGLVRVGRRGSVVFEVYFPRLLRFPQQKKKPLYLK